MKRVDRILRWFIDHGFSTAEFMVVVMCAWLVFVVALSVVFGRR